MNEEYDDEYNEDDGFHIWKHENTKELREDFIKEHQKEFDEMLSNNIIDDTFDIDYWKESFCEEMEQEFYDYCEDSYNNYCDIVETENSILRAIDRGRW